MSDVRAPGPLSETDPEVHDRGAERPWPEADPHGKSDKTDETKSTATQEPTSDPPPGRDLGDGPS